MKKVFQTIVVLLLLAGAMPFAGADTRSDLEQAKERLHDLEGQIESSRARLADLRAEMSAQQDRLAEIQGELDALAVRIDHATSRVEQTRQEILDTKLRIRAVEARYRNLRAQLDARARAAYESGPAATLGLLLGADNVGDLSDRMAFVDAIAKTDLELANDVANQRNELDARRRGLESVRAREEDALRSLEREQDALSSKWDEQRSILDDVASKEAEAESVAAGLADDQAEVSSLIGRLADQLKQEELEAAREAARNRAADNAPTSPPGDGASPPESPTGDPAPTGSPFSACPVGTGRAYGDSFGAPRYAGGYHPHAGADIMAPRGTPVYAPFSGVAEQHPNPLGGLAVVVYGSQGWVYNAHLNSYGASGQVSAGTIIGYVGDSGDARGGPTHDHFEWHPNVIPSDPYVSVYGVSVVGDAIDPYPYLNQVC